MKAFAPGCEGFCCLYYIYLALHNYAKLNQATIWKRKSNRMGFY